MDALRLLEMAEGAMVPEVSLMDMPDPPLDEVPRWLVDPVDGASSGLAFKAFLRNSHGEDASGGRSLRHLEAEAFGTRNTNTPAVSVSGRAELRYDNSALDGFPGRQRPTSLADIKGTHPSCD